MKKIAFDVECYPNFFLVVFSDRTKIRTYCRFNDRIHGEPRQIRAILRQCCLVSFNGSSYDLPMLAGFLAGWSNEKLKRLSDFIYKERRMAWQLNDRFPDLVVPPYREHIDLTGVTPLMASLKTYACRIHVRNLQDLPIDPDTTLTREQVRTITNYCENDTKLTWAVYDHMRPQIKLREDIGRQYGLDMRSKSDPQIAEAILRQELQAEGVNVYRQPDPKDLEPFRYTDPGFIKFSTKTLQDVFVKVLCAEFTVNSAGRVVLPESIDMAIHFAGATYKLGIGGLHSQEKRQVVEPTSGENFGELDVASMYPSIILGQKLYPEHLTGAFIDLYRRIYDERMEAKRSGNKVKADTYKIVLNGSYGKFGSKYSFLYSPQLLIQTTITGQLCLLMLIEQLTEGGATVTSANTDGVNVRFKKGCPRVIARVKAWEAQTGLKLEWTPYRAVYSESVNSYVAIKHNSSAKTKGLYEDGSIAKGYAAQICNDAVIAYLSEGVPLASTVNACSDIRKFLTMRGVRTGGHWRGKVLGKVVRWYRSRDGEPIRYANGSRVAGSDGARPMMTLSDDIPEDLDRQWYIDQAERKLKRLGYERI